MLLTGPRSLRLVATPETTEPMTRLYRRFALGCGVVAGWTLLVAVLWAVLGWPGDGAPATIRWAGPAGMLFCTLVTGGLALFFLRAVRLLRRTAGSEQSLLLGVDPDGVDLPAGRRLGYHQVAGVAVAWHPLRRPPAPGMKRLGRQLGSGLTSRAGMDGVVRRVDLTTTAGETIPVSIGPWATDAEFGRVLQVLQHELGRHGRPGPTRVEAG